MLSDDKVDLVYIAVPHSHHHKWTIEALNAGRNVLCEKAFAANTKQAEEMIALAEEKKLLLAEAIWTRYMPSRKIIDDIIKSGKNGKGKEIHVLQPISQTLIQESLRKCFQNLRRRIP